MLAHGTLRSSCGATNELQSVEKRAQATNASTGGRTATKYAQTLSLPWFLPAARWKAGPEASTEEAMNNASVQELIADNAQLRADLTASRRAEATGRAETAELHTQVTRLQTTVATLEAELAELRTDVSTTSPELRHKQLRHKQRNQIRESSTSGVNASFHCQSGDDKHNLGPISSSLEAVLNLGSIDTSQDAFEICHEVATRLQKLLRPGERRNGSNSWTDINASSMPALHHLVLGRGRSHLKLTWVGAGTGFEIACLALIAREPFEVVACDTDSNAICMGHQLLDVLGASGTATHGVRYLRGSKIVLDYKDGMHVRSARGHDLVYSMAPANDALCRHLYRIAWHAGARLALLSRSWRHARLPSPIPEVRLALELAGSKVPVEVVSGRLGPKLECED